MTATNIRGSRQDQGPDSVLELCHDLTQYVRAAQFWLGEGGELDLLEGYDVHRRLARAAEVLDVLAELIAQTVGRARGSVPHPQRVDLLALVHQLARTSAADVTVQSTLEDTRTTSLADADLLTRAIGNLVDNAARASAAAGCHTVHVRVSAEPGGTLIEVEDEGPGFGMIDPGTGRGLCVVGSAVAACRGTLEIVSGPPPGTTVRLHLPRHPQDGTA